MSKTGPLASHTVSGIAIELYVDERTAHAGECITGRLCVQNPEPLTLRSIRVRLSGSSHTSWHYYVGGGRNYYTGVDEPGERRTRHSTVDLVPDVFCVVFGAARGAADSSLLQPGSHSWPFSLALPTTLPPTCNLEHGRISYQLSGYVKIPLGSDVLCEAPVLVRSHQLPPPTLFQLPPVQQATVQLPTFFCCGDAGQTVLSLALPQGGPVLHASLSPQAELAVAAGMASSSRRFPGKAQVQLRRYHHFRADGHAIRVCAVLGRCDLVPNLLSSTPFAGPVTSIVTLPPCLLVQPSFTSQLIDISYQLELQLTTWGSETTLEHPLWVQAPAAGASQEGPQKVGEEKREGGKEGKGGEVVVRGVASL